MSPNYSLLMLPLNNFTVASIGLSASLLSFLAEIHTFFFGSFNHCHGFKCQATRWQLLDCLRAAKLGTMNVIYFWSPWHPAYLLCYYQFSESKTFLIKRKCYNRNWLDMQRDNFSLLCRWYCQEKVEQSIGTICAMHGLYLIDYWGWMHLPL